MSRKPTTAPRARTAAKPPTSKPPAPALEAPPEALKNSVVDPAMNPTKVSAIVISRWSEAQFKQARHAINPEVNTPYEQLLDPSYYANIAPKVLSGDVIEVRPAEGSYYAELFVWAKGPNWLQVSVLVKIDRPTSAAMPSANKAFSIEFVEGPTKYRVIRNSDRGQVASGFDSPELANTWLSDNARRVAA